MVGKSMARSRAFQKVNRPKDSSEQFDGRLDIIRSRVGLLAGKDRAIMQMYLDNSGTFRRMARLARVNEANVARRIHKLVRRLLDGQYITCLRSRHKFTGEQICIARDYFVDGLPMSKIAEKQRVSYSEVRQTMKKIQRITSVDADDR
jgi:transposase-like protein